MDGAGVAWPHSTNDSSLTAALFAGKAQAGARRDIAYGLATYTRAVADETESTVLGRFDLVEAKAAVEELSDLQQQAVQLVYFSGVTVPQIASLLGVPTPTLRTRLRDGLQPLREILTAAELSPEGR